MNSDRSAETSWVDRRYQCSLPWILDELCQIADANVGRVNDLPCQALKDHPFRLEGQAKQGRFEVVGWPIGSDRDGSPPHRVTFRIDGDRIAVSPDIVVTRRWDAFEEECFLSISIGDKADDRRYTTAKVVQLALEPLFFT